MFVLVAHFSLTEPPGKPIPDSAQEPLALLAASSECRRLYFARSTESAIRYVLVAEFDSASHYRRSLSPWPMRTVVIPWLSTAQLDLTQVNEVLLSSIDGATKLWQPTVDNPGR